MAALPDSSPTAVQRSGSILNVVPAGVIWGFSFFFIKVAVEGMAPLTLTALRVALGAVVVLAAARATGARLPHGRDEWRLCATYTVVSTAIPFTCFAWAAQRVPSALAGVLNGTTPLFTLLVGLAVARSEARLGKRAGLGIAVGFVGVAVTAGVGSGDLSSTDQVAGAIACVVAAACYGFGFVFARRHLGHMGVITITSGQLIVATILTAPIGLGAALLEGFRPTPTRVLAVAALGFVGTGFAFLFNQRAIAVVGATRASLVTYLVPMVAVAVGVVLADEPFTWRLVAGGALVVVGVSLSRPRRPVAQA